jgi:NAD(P)-dependent dehydrogenase (short-subunit alcohol dehydrogenase family)
MENVKGKVAFITGGASGIGLGMAKAFVKAGMRVVITDVREDRMQEASAGFEKLGQGGSVRCLKLDVTDRKAFAWAADEVENIFGNVHILCNNAGVGILGSIKHTKFDDWDWGLSVLIGGVVNGIQTFLPRMLKHREGGHIVTTSSMGGALPLSESPIYSTAKAGVIAMCECLRGDLAGDNIGVSAFCPGPVATNIRETGGLRPERYRSDSGLAELEKDLANRENSPNWMSIEECGERVLQGIQRNDLFIFTHREFREGVEERMRAMVASFPDEEINQARAGEIPHLISNPIYRHVLEALRKRG